MRFFISLLVVAAAASTDERCDNSDLTWAWMSNRVQVPSRCRELYLIGTGIGDNGAAALAQALPLNPQLVSLSLYDNGEEKEVTMPSICDLQLSDLL